MTSKLKAVDPNTATDAELDARAAADESTLKDLRLEDFYAYMLEHKYIFVPSARSGRRRASMHACPTSATSRQAPGSTRTAPSSR